MVPHRFRVLFWILVAATLALASNPAQAAPGHGGGAGHALAPHGFYHGGPYRYGFHPYGFYGRPGFYRPYYGFGVGLGLGVGVGLGYGLYGAYAPYYGYGYGYGPPPVLAYPPGVYGAGVAPGAPPPAPPPPPNGQPQTAPAPDNAAHLQLTVPEKAEVWFQGTRTTQTGRVREFTSAPLTPGTSYTYKISVRYTDASGKAVNDTRDIHVRANDWFSIDFTQPPPANPPNAPPPNLLPPMQRP
jgi:uncharacterized protein (TIGR03000 family)